MMRTQPADSKSKYADLRRLLESEPANAALRRDCIALAVSLADFDFVLQNTAATLASAPQDAEARFNRATAFIGKRDYRAALEILGQLHVSGAGADAVELNRALCHYCLSEYDLAVLASEGAYTRGVRSSGLLRILVSALHHAGALERAVEIADANAAVGSTDGALAGVYALVYLDSGDSPKADHWATAALKNNPDSVDGLIVKATVLTEQMELQSAETLLQKALQLMPGTGRAWLGLGTLALLRNDLPLAREQLTRGLEQLSSHVGSWHVLAWTEVLSGDAEAAERAFLKSLELNRNFAETHGGLAIVAALRGNQAEAQRLMQVARRLDSECLSAQFAESVLTGRSGDAEKARQIILSTATKVAGESDSPMSRVLHQAARRS